MHRWCPIEKKDRMKTEGPYLCSSQARCSLSSSHSRHRVAIDSTYCIFLSSMDRAPYSDVRGIQKQAPEMDAREERKDSFLSRRRFLFLGTPKANKDRRRFSSPGAVFLANMVRAWQGLYGIRPYTVRSYSKKVFIRFVTWLIYDYT